MPMPQRARKLRRRPWRREPDSLQPQLPYRNLDAIVQQVSAQFFQHAFDDVTWCFVLQRMLACISRTSRSIRIHNVLNGTDVPEDVFVTIIFHEMLHLEISPATTRSGKSNPHPPAFWEAERQRSPNYDASWEWIQMNLPLRRRPRLQCTDVVPGVKRLTPEQRAWARERFGVALPRVTRSDEPSSRRISIETWRIAIAARYQPKTKP
jgi:hypothetical protein